MERTKEMCQGCRAGGCLFVKNDREELCSCIECLVKVVCNQWCDKRLRDTSLLNIEEITKT
jgi:hypothetical protein